MKTLRGFNASAPEGERWQITVLAESFPLLWGESPLSVLAAGSQVKLLKRGQQFLVNEEEVRAYLPPPELLQPEDVLQRQPYGRWRNPARYFSASGIIPPLYGLQNAPPTDQQIQLHQFLLSLEQWLSNRFAMLADVPRLLSFQRSLKETPALWGAQWPFITDPLIDPQAEISHQVHHSYADKAMEEVERQSRDLRQEMALLDWLLSYFGQDRTPRILLSDPQNEYYPVQRGWLSEQASIGYGGSSLRIGEISAPIKRIAARLGVGAVLFESVSEETLRSLPFYLIEHWALLPEPVNAEEGINDFAVKGIDNADAPKAPDEVWLTLDDEAAMSRGQQIDLILGSAEGTPFISNLVISQIKGKRVMIISRDYASVRNNWQYLVNAVKNGVLFWRGSSLWLLEKAFPYEDKIGDGAQSEEAWFALDPLSPLLRVGDTLRLHESIAKGRQIKIETPFLLEAKVLELDPLRGRLLLSSVQPFPEENNTQRFWYPAMTNRERFSLTVSLVFNRERLLGDTQQDPDATIRWIRQVVDEEMPAHIRTLLHWFSTEDFSLLGAAWADWQNNGEPHGDLAYKLLSWLSLGQLPPRREGLGAMHLATEDDLREYADEASFWREETYESMREADVLFVPQDPTPSGIAVRHIATQVELAEHADDEANWQDESALITHKIHYISKPEKG